MPRCLGLTLISLLVALSSEAQDMPPQGESPFTKSTHERIHGGIRTGLGLTLTNPSYATLTGGQSLSWTIGGLGLLKLSRRYQFEAEISYQRVGSLLKNASTQTDSKMNLNFITTGIAIRRTNLFRGALSDLYISVGPNLSYWMSGSGTWKSSSTETPFQVEFTQSVDSANASMQVMGANRWLVAADIGIGVGIPIARRQKIFLEASVSLGITNLGEDGSSCYLAAPGFTSDFASGMLTQRLHTVWLTASYTFVHNTMESRLGKSTTEKSIKRRDSKKQKKDKTYLNTRIKSSKKK